jgi:LCP family protein required for cell wall assembly
MSKKSLIIVFLFLCVITGDVFGVLYLKSLMDKPLGPSLKGNPSERTASASTQSVSDSNILQTPIQDQNQNTTLLLTPTIGTPLPPLCGNTPVLTVLAVGIDFRGDNYLYGLADVIRIVRVDFTTHNVSVLTIDRAIWVEIPGISSHYGVTHGLLNQAYFFGVPAMGYYDGPGGGAGLLAKTLKKNFDLDVDNYVVVDMGVFVKFVDALGGVDVNLPAPVDGTPDFPFFNAGQQHLSGTQALELARIREKYSTLIRDSNQDIIIRAIFNKLSSPDIIVKVPKLVQAFQNAGLTDLSHSQIENMVCLLRKMDRTNLTFRSIPDKYYIYAWIYDDYMHQDENIWNVDFNIFRSYIRDFMNGQWPQD